MAFESPYKFGWHKGKDYVLDICGDHVWRNEESGLLMLRSPIINTFPCFKSNEWIISKWPCRIPAVGASHGVKGSDRGARAHLPPTSGEQRWEAYTEIEGRYVDTRGTITVEQQDVNEYRIQKIRDQAAEKLEMAAEIAALKAQLALLGK